MPITPSPTSIPVVTPDKVPVGVDIDNPYVEALKAGDHDALRHLGFGRKRQAYSTIDGTPAFDKKLPPPTCTHGQFLDIVIGISVRCLDCGAEVEIAPQPDPDHPGQFLPPWSIKVGTETLPDEDLKTHRDHHDLIWFGDGTEDNKGIAQV